MPRGKWIKASVCSLLGCLVLLAGHAGGARPRFDTSTDMGLVLVPADAEIESVIFRLRATDQDADFPLVFDVTATVTPVVRIDNLPCTLYNKICQANVILTRRLTPGRLHDFAVRVRDSKGDSNSMQATISVTNATTQRDKIFPHIPAIIMVPEDAKPGKELDYILVRSNQWSGKPVYIELWQPKELFTIRQRQTPAETRGVITLTGELDFETQSMYTLTIYATDPYTEPKKDTRNIAGLQLVVVVQDVQDVPPIFRLAPPLTKINNTVQPGDVILRVHAEDGDKGVPREVTYGLVSEGNPFTPFFNISETTGEIILARPLEDLTQITRVGAPVVLSVVAEEIRRSTMEPPAQATVVEVGLLLGEPGNSPPFFESDNYVAWMDENAEPGSVVTFAEHYSTKVKDEDIGKAGVFALKLDNNNGTFEISPAVAERTANFIITVRDGTLIDYETHKSLRFKIVAQEVGPATNLSATVPATIFLRDVNDNAPEFEASTYEVTLSENVTAGTRVVRVHATDRDTGLFGRIQYTRLVGPGGEAFVIDPDTGIITIAGGTSALDRETTPSLRLSVEARDEDGKGLRGTVPLIVNLLDVNDNAPIFEADTYRFTLNEDTTNFTMPAIIRAVDADAEPPNNEIRYELIHGNYENKFYLNEITGEILLREPINKIRRTRDNPYQNFAAKFRRGFVKVQKTFENMTATASIAPAVAELPLNSSGGGGGNWTDDTGTRTEEDAPKIRKKREDDDVLFTLTARAYDLGVPHMSGVTRVKVLRGPVAGARNVMFVVPGENPDPAKTAETLAAITGGRIAVQEIRPYTSRDVPSGSGTNVPSLEGGKKSIVVARVEPIGGGASLVDIERIRAALAANGVGVISGDAPIGNAEGTSEAKSSDGGTTNRKSDANATTNITAVHNEQVTVYRAENRLLFWLLIILGLLVLAALIALVVCCICPGCPFYMAPRKRRVHSADSPMARSDGRPKRHLRRKQASLLEASWQGRKQAWSADPTRRNWQFNRRNHRAAGLASLPGDVRVLEREGQVLEKAGSLRLHDGPIPVYLADSARRPAEERIYMEDAEGLGAQGYGVVDADGGSEAARETYVGEEEHRVNEQPKLVREQHFYREGNAEVLRLVTRGQTEEEGAIARPAHRPGTRVAEQGQCGPYRVDGKDILLRRFIEDQKMRHANGGQDLHDSLQDIERRSMESHQRQKEAMNLQQQQQQKILLVPERLEEDRRQHIEELGPDVQRLIIDHGSFEKAARFEPNDGQEFVPGPTLVIHAPMAKVSGERANERSPKKSVNVQSYTIHDLELARQNALLTRLLLERESREAGVGAMGDTASYLETQSLPGQVAIATQTDRTAATQTELPNRSRSDNDESEEEARMRRKLRSKKRYACDEPRRIGTLWIKSPIEEEDARYSTEKRTIVLRKKIKDIKDSRRISLEPEVLREISDSLDENGEPSIATRRAVDRDDSDSRMDSRNGEEIGRFEDSSSIDLNERGGGRIATEKPAARGAADGQPKRKSQRGQREIVVEPSFRILEKEMSSISRKLSKLAGKKILRSSNGSETDSREKVKTLVAESKRTERRTDARAAETKKPVKLIELAKTKRSKSTPRTAVSEGATSTKERAGLRDDNIVQGKQRQAPKYGKGQTVSTGSSDFEEALEKPSRKQHSRVAHVDKQKQMTAGPSHVKLKRQTKVERKEAAGVAPPAVPRETSERKDTSDSASKGSAVSGKNERDRVGTKKYSDAIGKGKTESGPQSSSGSDHSKDSKLGSERALAVDDHENGTSGAREKSDRASQEDISKVSADSIGEASRAKTAMEGKEQSPEAPKTKLKIVPGTVATQRKDRPCMSPADERLIGESVTAPTTVSPISGERAEQREALDSIEEHALTMPKEALNDFLTHEIRDSAQALRAQRRSATEVAERIEGVAPRSVSTETEDGEDAGSAKVLDNMKLGNRGSTDAVRRDVSESFELSDKESAGVSRDEGSFGATRARHSGDAAAAEKDISGMITLEDKGEASIFQETALSERHKLYERGDTSDVGADDVPDAIEVETEDVAGLATKQEMPERAKLADRKSAEVMRKEEASERAKIEGRKSSDVAQTDEMPGEPTKTEEGGRAGAVRVDELSEGIELKDGKGRDAAWQDEAVEPANLEDRKSVDVIQRGQVPELGTSKNADSTVPVRKVEEPSKSIKFDRSDHFEEREDLSKDAAIDADSIIEKSKVIAEQSEDAGMFSDNFDSFCGTDVHQKNSLENLASGEEFSYETLQSESSEDQTSTTKQVAPIKVAVETDDATKTIDKPMKISSSSEVETKEEIEETRINPPKTPTLPRGDDESPESTAATPLSCRPEEKANESKDSKIETRTEDTNDVAPAELDTDTSFTVKHVLDIPKGTSEFIESPQAGQVVLIKPEDGRTVTVPIVPPLDIKVTDETGKQFPPEQSKSTSEIRIASPRSLSRSEEIVLERGSQKEFGIADSLFVDAKLLKSPLRSGGVVANNAGEEEPHEEKLNQDEKKIGIDIPLVNLVELSRVMLEDADDSDSSEASSKTMLTARPYGTPRHRAVPGNDNVRELQVSEIQSTDQPIESTEAVSKEMRLGSEKAGESVESPIKNDEKSPETPIEARPGISEAVTDDTVALGRDAGEALLGVTSSDGQPARVGVAAEREAATTTHIGEEDSKTLEISAVREGNGKMDAPSEKVQQLCQIRQEKLPAGADGFDSLPEMDKPVKSLGDTKVPEQVRTLPVDVAKTAVGAPIANVPGAATRNAMPSTTGKDAKGIVRKKDSPKEDAGTLSKRPKRERKTKTLKEESSKIGKRSVVVGQFERSRDSERQAPPVELRVEERGHPSSRTGQLERTRSKVNRPAKNIQQRAKVKAEKSKKALPRSESEKSMSKRSSESRATRAELVDSGLKKIQEGKKNVGKRMAEEASKAEKPRRLDLQEIVGSGASEEKENREIVDASKETQVELSPTAEGKEESPTRGETPEKEVETGTEYAGELSLQEGTAGLPEDSASTNVETESPERTVNKNLDKMIVIAEQTTMIDDTPGTIPSGKTKEARATKEIPATKNSTTTEEKKTMEGAPTTNEERVTEDETTAREETVTQVQKAAEERTTPKETAMSGEETVRIDPMPTDEGTAAVAPVARRPVAIEVSRRPTDVPVKNLDVTKLSEEAIEGTDGTRISNLQSEIGANTASSAAGVGSSEVAKKMEPSRRTPELVDVSASQAKSAKSFDRKVEEKRKSEGAVGEGTWRESSRPGKPLAAEGSTERATGSPRRVAKHRRDSETVTVESQSRYMEWYKLKREEMERKRQERKDAEEEEERPKWLRKSTRQRWFKGGPDDKRIFDRKIGEKTPRRKKIKPLVNLESEQLRAIVRQGRALRKAQGEKSEEPQIQIFAPEKPPTPLYSVPVSSRYHHHHHLVQHSEYKYEKMPLTPFYLHPPPAPRSSPQISPQPYEGPYPEQYQSLPSDSRCPNEAFDSGTIVQQQQQQQQQGGSKLRHQQLLEKKSVFDIAYSEAAPSHLRADSTTPPS